MSGREEHEVHGCSMEHTQGAASVSGREEHEVHGCSMEHTQGATSVSGREEAHREQQVNGAHIGGNVSEWTGGA